MAWTKESSLTGGNVIWTQTDGIIWSAAVMGIIYIWTGVEWIKESKATLKDIWNTTLSDWEDTNQGRWDSGWIKET
jgi:hypothetical protein